MGLFKVAELQEIAAKAIDAGLAPRREDLLFAFPPKFLASLSGWNTNIAASALKADLGDLNEIPDPLDGEVPFTTWLKNASAMVFPRQGLAKFFDDMALLATQRSSEQLAAAGQPAAPPAGGVAVPEQILFKTALLPDSYVKTASVRAQSVARLSVTAYENGSERKLPSGNPDGVYGTGWLIGPKHLITNWHVVAARRAGEADPNEGDLQLQVANMKVEFDYVSREGQHDDPVPVVRLVHRNKALDFVILELDLQNGRAAIPLAQQLPVIDAQHPLAANIIQHPAGEPRQFAIRNNLIAVVQGNDVAYFTDTAGGSSGSPVCDDRWRVIALHKASTAQFGNFEFQGKHTAWVNVGTLISAICDDLKRNADAVWTAIGATME